MEVKKTLLTSVLISILVLVSCSSTPELETGEIKTLAILDQALKQSNKAKRFIDSRLLLTRKQIDKAKLPVLFVELLSGQNGTLTPYPGQGIGQTWLGADGATITLERGILKASRGMGDDLMGSSSSMPVWSNINKKTENYSRELNHITGNNMISKRIFNCNIEKTSSDERIKVWEVNFKVDRFEENCSDGSFAFKNTYQVDARGIVRRSSQYHSETLGSILIERLDR